MKYKSLICMAGLVAALAANPVQADVLSSFIPDANPQSPGNSAANIYGLQMFFVPVALSRASYVNSFSIYTYSEPNYRYLGPNFTGLQFEYLASTPTLGNLGSAVGQVLYNATIDNVGTTSDPNLVRLTVDIAPILLQAGTYWFSLSSKDWSQDIGWNYDYVPSSDLMAYAYYSSGVTDVNGGSSSLYYSLGGTVAVPGPVVGAGLPPLFGLAGLTAWRRRRRQAASLTGA